jgi:cyclopropane-fatty-acyl-phospholipid synthase
VSIGAFEHFGPDRYDDFFKMAHNILPADGVMLLHTITSLMKQQMIDRGLPITDELVQFIKFIATEIFPGGWTPTLEMVEEHSAKAGFTLTRRQSLQPHYARTLDLWAQALEAHKDEAIEIQSEDGVRALYEAPDRLRQDVPDRVHRRQPVHPGEVVIAPGLAPRPTLAG